MGCNHVLSCISSWLSFVLTFKKRLISVPPELRRDLLEILEYGLGPGLSGMAHGFLLEVLEYGLSSIVCTRSAQQLCMHFHRLGTMIFKWNKQH